MRSQDFIIKLIMALVLAWQLPGTALAQNYDHTFVQNSNNAGILCNQANKLAGEQKYDQALPLFQQACALDPNGNSASVHTNFGIMLKHKGEVDEAIAELNKALQFAPDSLVAKCALASCLSSKGIELTKAQKYEEAKPIYQQAMAIKDIPADALAKLHTCYANLLEKTGHLEEALAENKIALQYDPQCKSVIYNIGCCYEHLGDIDQAKKYLTKYVNDFPNEPNRDVVLATIGTLNRSKSTWVSEVQDMPDYLNSVTADRIEVWPKKAMPLKVFIPVDSNLPGFRPSFTEILKASFDAWMQAASNYLSWQMVPNPQNADIVCAWANSNKGLSHQDAEQGETYRNYLCGKHGECELTHASIKLCFVDPTTNEVVSDKVMTGLCLHEIGHALGLKGHSSNHNDVMFFATGEVYQLRKLSDRDITTINRLYKKYQADVTQ